MCVYCHHLKVYASNVCFKKAENHLKMYVIGLSVAKDTISPLLKETSMPERISITGIRIYIQISLTILLFSIDFWVSGYQLLNM